MYYFLTKKNHILIILMLLGFTIIFILLIIGYYVTQNDAFIFTALAVGLYGILAPKGYVNGKPVYGGEPHIILTRDESKKSDPAYIYVSPEEEKRFLSEMKAVESKYNEFYDIVMKSNIIHLIEDRDIINSIVHTIRDKTKEYHELFENMSGKLLEIYDLLVSNNINRNASNESFSMLIDSIDLLNKNKHAHDDYYNSALRRYHVYDEPTVTFTRDESKKSDPAYLYVSNDDEKSLIELRSTFGNLCNEITSLYNEKKLSEAKLKCQEFLDVQKSISPTVLNIYNVYTRSRYNPDTGKFNYHIIRDPPSYYYIELLDDIKYCTNAILDIYSTNLSNQ